MENGFFVLPFKSRYSRGHLDGHETCPMKNFNPHDWARQKHEDPVTFMKQNIYEHKQKLILRHASLPLEMRDNDNLADQLVHSDDDENGMIVTFFDYYLFRRRRSRIQVFINFII